VLEGKTPLSAMFFSPKEAVVEFEQRAKNCQIRLLSSLWKSFVEIIRKNPREAGLRNPNYS
jgi:hypothetical protein